MEEFTMEKQENAAKKGFQSAGLQKLLTLGALVILYAFFCIFGSRFATSATLVSILDSTYYVALMAFGITFVIITGGIDLSIGTNMMCSALIGGYLYTSLHLPIVFCLFIIVLNATIFGWINGLLISRLKLPLHCHTGRYDDDTGNRRYCHQCSDSALSLGV